MPNTQEQKILIIEDESPQLKALQDKFTREGFVIIYATNGEEGLESALRERPNLILLDIVLPKMDGLTVMKKLRQENEWGKTVPIIILSNLTADDERMNNSIAENEPAYYLIKSNWTLDDVVARVRERLARIA